MPEKVLGTEAQGATDDMPAAPAQPPVTTPPKRSPGHRGQDVRDTMAEMAARAHEISLEAGSKMAGAMKSVIHAAAGITGFAVESARDLVQYMVRRGQMTQDEADKLLRDVEEAAIKRGTPLPKAASQPAAAAPKPAPSPAPTVAAKAPAAKAAPVPPPAPKASAPTASAKPAPKVEAPAAKKSAPAKKAAPLAKPAAKAPARGGSVKASAKATKVAAKPAAKGAAKKGKK